MLRIRKELQKCLTARLSVVFVLYAVISVVALLLSNIVVVKNFSFFNIDIGGYAITITSSVIVFPLIYITSDIFSEVYGYVWSRLISWIAFFMNILMVVVFKITIVLPGNDPVVADSFRTIHDSGFGILAASLIAYMFGDLFNDIVFERMKRRDRKNTDGQFMLRSLLSSFCGEVVDTGVFLPTLFLLTGQFGTTIRDFGQLLAIILIQGTLKVVMELILFPLTILIVHKTRAYEAHLRSMEP